MKKMLIVYCCWSLLMLYGQEKEIETTFENEVLTNTSWGGGVASQPSIAFYANEVMLRDPVSKFEASFPYCLSNDSIKIEFDDKIFRGSCIRQNDSLFIYGKMNGQTYDWRYRYSKISSEKMLENEEKMKSFRNTPQADLMKPWIAVGASDCAPHAGFIFEGDGIFFVGDFSTYPYSIKSDSLFYTEDNQYKFKGTYSIVNDTLVLDFNSVDTESKGISGKYVSFSRHEKAIRKKYKTLDDWIKVCDSQ